MAQPESEEGDRRKAPESHDDALSLTVTKNADGINVNVQRGMDMVEGTWATWEEMGVEPRSEGSVSEGPIFEFSEDLDDETEEDAR